MTLELALFGHPVAHSRSPALHAAFGRSTGIALRYRLIDVPSGLLGGALHAFVAAGGRGANVTLPCKRDALSHCATLSERARLAGAVNLLQVGTDRSLHGDNVDGVGLIRDLTINHQCGLRDARVLLCGAGGAARAALAALRAAGATVQLANRDALRAVALARDLGGIAGGGYAAARGPFELVINATAASLAGEALPLDTSVLRDALAYDLMYADQDTPFMSAARAAGARRVLDGWGMLVEQAAESFLAWTGERPETAALLQNRL